ncbi:MAG: type II secretion system minor pseudopilin GspI [Hylemonella sp.]|uniref:type II secretion system minor pseudopilin GspI n=1 Tax=Hylemonella sp. TaxID=2066020 RepID=UPI0022BAD805|nr:type II secretion system minor pseudopilin GspI [Hylemonella sp.]MCZ8252329.1 type II secretion system minor pseudopilin GspI [Hylemonella sp.]
MGPHRRRSRGFTLIEVLVALAIVAIALMTGLSAMGALSQRAQRQSDVMLAQLCAENALIGLRLAHQMPGTGELQLACAQGGQPFGLRLSTRPTPNPNFMRVEARVERDGVPLLQLITVLGRD